MRCRLRDLPHQALQEAFSCGRRKIFRHKAVRQTSPVTSTSLSSTRHFTRSATHHILQAVPTLPSWDLDTFRTRAFIPQLPALLPCDVSNQPPAWHSWFETDRQHPPSRRLSYEYLRAHGSAIVPLELTRQELAGAQTFERFDAPLTVFLDWMQAAEADSPSPDAPPTTTSLYLAQCSISSLPATLQSDIPTPTLVLQAGKGDLYDANVWIGRPPTYTPLHRDPNPNLFLQLVGAKMVRLFAPDVGREIFGAVQEVLGMGGGGNAVFRGEEMMRGEERAVLEREVWEEGVGKLVPGAGGEGYEVLVREGHALFIPLGWWHSIKSVGRETSASVNWWFR